MSVLLVHGLSSTTAELYELGALLRERGLEVHNVVLPGHGGVDQESLNAFGLELYIQAVEQPLHTIVAARREPVTLVGISFGALLSMYVAEQNPALVSKLVLLSVPGTYRNRIIGAILSALSYFPDFILRRMPTIVKGERPAGTFKRQRIASSMHYVSAAARLFRLKRRVFSKLKLLRSKILIIQDPYDHHWIPSSIELLKRSIGAQNVEISLFPGGQHELTRGPFCEEVERCVAEFLQRT